MNQRLGKIEDVAFKIIRKREFPHIGKVHQIMRNLLKWLSVTPEVKKDLYKITQVPHELEIDKRHNPTIEDSDYISMDKVWARRNQEILYGCVRKANNIYEQEKISETPLELLEAALKKLQHNNMEMDAINKSDRQKAKKLIKQIREALQELEDELYDLEKKH